MDQGYCRVISFFNCLLLFFLTPQNLPMVSFFFFLNETVGLLCERLSEEAWIAPTDGRELEWDQKGFFL